MNKDAQRYYIGLDCGTSSVGWAVTDENYNLLRANGKIKKNGKTKTKPRTLWGVRLFDEADTAAERRSFRCSRRRLRRSRDRLKLLRMLFCDEMAKIDPEFYKRLKESFYFEADKRLKNKSKNTLFNDPSFTDKDYFKAYPTIWHLRQAIIDPKNTDRHFDLRLYFLAIQHILKHRGHFLFEGNFSIENEDFSRIFEDFCDAAAKYGFNIERTMADDVEQILLSNSTLNDKKKQIGDKALFIEDEELESEEAKRHKDGEKALAQLIVGGKADLAKIFGLELDEKCSYSLGQLDEKEAEITDKITSDNMDLLIAAKRIYDYGVLHKLLGNYKLISEAMVANYEQHQQDLKALKSAFKLHSELYRKLFKETGYDKSQSSIGFPPYAAYIGEARSEKGKSASVNQEDFNKHLEKCLTEIGYEGELLERARRSELLPKQRGQAKGTIPQQLHHKELERILGKLAKEYHSFAEETKGEAETFNTKVKKIALLHSFRLPYYCGPLVKGKFDKDGKAQEGGKSEFSWADEEINELVHPWNFDKIMTRPHANGETYLDARANNFIRRMTNECTYLPSESVLPKASLLYQKYMTLNELNNLKINGQRIENDLKQAIFEEAFLSGALSGNITLKRLSKWLKDNQFLGENDDLSGTSEAKFLPKLSTQQDFTKALGEGFQNRYEAEKLEEAIEAITILGEEKSMLKRKLARLLGLDEGSEEIKKLVKLSYKDWGRLSEDFLNGITANINGIKMTILDALWHTPCNLMELLSGDYGFKQAISEYNKRKHPNVEKQITYQDVQNLYCSPAVKRSIWQTLRIVKELVKTKKAAPAKIFLEVARGDDDKAKGKYTSKRREQLEKLYREIKNSPDAQKLLSELDEQDDRNLQSKKLYLYFVQMGKCAYSGELIDLEDINNTSLYDIDHIYPRSLTKDDSITRNLVLVKAEYNRKKTNKFLCEFPDWQNQMQRTWQYWYAKNLITKEKYDRLIRRTKLNPNELGDFIARQLVETSQSVKAIRDLLNRAYPKTEVVMVKAGQVSDFRQLMSSDKKDRNGNIIRLGQPEFIKLRELNDYHHAKDAYLNIVVGNVMNETFTSDPRHWIKARNGDYNYSIQPHLLFRDAQEYIKHDGKKTCFPDVKGWNFAESLQIISNTMKCNDILWTRMSYIESSELTDLQPVPHPDKDKISGLLPLKQNRRLIKQGIAKYGGYNSIKGAHFALIETKNKKGELERKIISIPQVYKNEIEAYVNREYNARAILPVIKFKSLMKVGDVLLHITCRTGDQIGFQHTFQLKLSLEQMQSLKYVSNIIKKIKDKKDYKIQEKWDTIDDERLNSLFDCLVEKIKIHRNTPTLNNAITRLVSAKGNFNKLPLEEKCISIMEILKALSCNAEKGDWSKFTSAKSLGSVLHSSNITGEDFYLINQSPTGLYQEYVNLQTVQPKLIAKGGKL